MTTLRILFVLSVLTPAASAAQDDAEVRHKIDSLRHLLPMLTGEAEREAYDDIDILIFEAEDRQAYLDFTDEYIARALELGDADMEGQGRVNRICHFHNETMIEQLKEEIGGHLEFFAEHQQWLRYFFSDHLYVNSLKIAGDVDAALSEANRMYDFASKNHNNLGQAMALFAIGELSVPMEQPDKAIASYREALRLLEKEDDDTRWRMSIEVGSELFAVLNTLGRYDEALETLRRNEEALIASENDGVNNNAARFNLMRNYIRAYIGLGDWEKADEYVALAKQSPIYNLPLGRLSVEREEWRVYAGKKDYGRALELMDDLYEPTIEISGMMEAYSLLSNIAEVAEKGEYYKRSSDAYKQLREQDDSIRKAESYKVLDEIRTRYEVDKITAQKEANRNYMLLALGGCLFLLSALGVYVIYSHRLKVRNRGLVERIREQDRIEEDLAAAREEAMRLRALARPTDAPIEEQEQEDALFVALRNLMKVDKIYTDSELTRHAVAERLGTNEVYLHEAVKRNTDLAFMEYINSQRLLHARKMLSNPSGHYTIEVVALDSGFGSVSTFHRLFRQNYGLTPKEFRKLTTL